MPLAQLEAGFQPPCRALNVLAVLGRSCSMDFGAFSVLVTHTVHPQRCSSPGATHHIIAVTEGAAGS